jgi:hypothetical protein
MMPDNALVLIFVPCAEFPSAGRGPKGTGNQCDLEPILDGETYRYTGG